MLKKILFLISLVIFTNFFNLALGEIVPLKKPTQSKEEKEQKLLIDILKPLPKPTAKKIIKKEEKKPEKNVASKKAQDLGFILPICCFAIVST